jgi:hypothetical protein
VRAHAAAADEEQDVVAAVASSEPLEEARVGMLLAVEAPLDELGVRDAPDLLELGARADVDDRRRTGCLQVVRFLRRHRARVGEAVLLGAGRRAFEDRLAAHQ